MARRRKNRAPRKQHLDPLDLFSGYLLPIDDPEYGPLLYYGRGKYTMRLGEFTHYKAWCIVGASDSEEELLKGAEMLLDEGGVIPS